MRVTYEMKVGPMHTWALPAAGKNFQHEKPNHLGSHVRLQWSDGRMMKCTLV